MTWCVYVNSELCNSFICSRNFERLEDYGSVEPLRVALSVNFLPPKLSFVTSLLIGKSQNPRASDLLYIFFYLQGILQCRGGIIAGRELFLSKFICQLKRP